VKRLQVILAAVAAIIIGLSWFTYTDYRQPSYKGKSLTEWLDLYRFSWKTVPSQEAADAVRHIGTNALPLLVTWVQEAQDMPPWREHLLNLASHWNLGEPLLESIASPQRRVTRAGWGFYILGEAARGAVPDLARVASERKSPSSEFAFMALGYLGKDALPPLLSMVTNTAFPPTLRLEALSSLGQMGHLGSDAHTAVVLLILCLDDPGLAPTAAKTLGRLHLESDITVPALIECTRSTNQGTRMQGVFGLEEFAPDARAAVPELTKLLSDPDFSVRCEATNALRLIAPEVLQQTSAP
jgi:hypothetical protein